MFHNRSVKGAQYICALKAKGRHPNRAAPMTQIMMGP